MPNNLGGMVTKMTARLDRVLAQETKTSFPQINDASLGEFVGVGEVKLPTVTIQGLGDYDRAQGFAPGDATIEWATYRLRFALLAEGSSRVVDNLSAIRLRE